MEIQIKIRDFLAYPDLSKDEPRLQVYVNGELQENVSRFAIDINADELEPHWIKKGEKHGLQYTIEKYLKYCP